MANFVNNSANGSNESSQQDTNLFQSNTGPQRGNNNMTLLGYLNVVVLDKDGNEVIRMPKGLPLYEEIKAHKKLKMIADKVGPDYEYKIKGIVQLTEPEDDNDTSFLDGF